MALSMVEYENVLRKIDSEVKWYESFMYLAGNDDFQRIFNSPDSFINLANEYILNKNNPAIYKTIVICSMQKATPSIYLSFFGNVVEAYLNGSLDDYALLIPYIIQFQEELIM